MYKHQPTGFTLIETLVALGVLGMFFTAVSIILQIIITNVSDSRVRTVALSLAQEKMEIIRNMPYATIGTIGGIPSGPIPQTEVAPLNGQNFIITTSIAFVDDPFDGLIPTDTLNTDYKRARIEVSWGGEFPARFPVSLITNIAPKGVETSVGGGTLFLKVFNSSGVPISNATVRVDNTSVNPNIHIQTLTNSNGNVVLPGAPACLTCYQISVTKPSYSTDRTYSQTEVANPLQPHASVLEAQVTQVSFAIDSMSSLIIKSYGSEISGFPPVSNVFFTLKGNKIIGYDTIDEPVYKYSYSTNTGGGTVTISGLEWDTYTIDFTNSAHLLAGSNPLVPISLLPGVNTSIIMSVVPKSNTSFLVAAKSTAGDLLASVSAQLTHLPDYDTTLTTGATGAANFGQAFFGGLSPLTYDLKLTLPGFQDATVAYNLTGINQEVITLIPNP